MNPYEHIAGGSLADIAEAAPENRVLKVSPGSDPKSVAGAIAFTVREAGAPAAILAGGSASINQAIKVGTRRIYILRTA